MPSKALISVFICIVLLQNIAAQDPDSTIDSTKKKTFFNNIFQQVRNAVYVNKGDSAVNASVLNAKSETPYLIYQGKIIRQIRIKQLGFEITFADTSNRIKYFGTRILNALHVDTRTWVIR